jgi:hypothetical protein
MGVMSALRSIGSVSTENSIVKEKKKLLDFLQELRVLEAKLWGVSLEKLETDEEVVIEDTNHIIHALLHKHDKDFHEFLLSKKYKEFVAEVEDLRKEFMVLKKNVERRDTLKNLISKYTIQLVDPSNYAKLEKIFLLEKQLYSVLDTQEEAFVLLLKELKGIKIITDAHKLDIFMQSLKSLRDVLAGHLDHHDLWKEERSGYSNTSNIIHSLIDIVNSDV